MEEMYRERAVAERGRLGSTPSGAASCVEELRLGADPGLDTDPDPDPDPGLDTDPATAVSGGGPMALALAAYAKVALGPAGESYAAISAAFGRSANCGSRPRSDPAVIPSVVELDMASIV